MKMYKCALCGKEVEKIKTKKMIDRSTGKSSEGRKYGDTLIILDV